MIRYQGTPSEVCASAPALWASWTAGGTLAPPGDAQRTARERWSLLKLVTKISIQRSLTYRPVAEDEVLEHRTNMINKFLS